MKSLGDEFESITTGNIIVLIEIKTVPRVSAGKFVYSHEDLLKGRPDAYLSNSFHALPLLKSHEVFHALVSVLSEVHRYKNNTYIHFWNITSF